MAEEHLGEWLSALLDGELAASEVTAVEEHLAICPDCVGELAVTRLCREALRALPIVDPPPRFIEDFVADPRSPLAPVIPLRHRRGLAPVAASVAATIAVLVFFGGSGFKPSVFQPQVAGALDQHASIVSALSDRGDMPESARPRGIDDMPAPYRAPLELDGGYRLVKAFALPQGLHLVYQSGRYSLSVFQTLGVLDIGALPTGGGPVEVGHRDGWRWWASPVDGRLVIFDLDGMVITVVGDESGDAVPAAAASLPEPRSLSTAQQLRRAATSVLDALSL